VRPVLGSLHAGSVEVPIHAYGLAIAVGFAVGIVIAARNARRAGFDPDGVLDLSFLILVAGVLSSRLAYVVVHADRFAGVCRGMGPPRDLGRILADCAAPLRIWEGGLVFYGGALGAALAALRFARKRGWRFARVADLFAPSLAIGHAVGRLGCLLAGCCFGKPVTGFIGIEFARGSVAFDEMMARGRLLPGTLATPALHATQIYEALGELAIFSALVRARGRVTRPGAIALAYALLYASLRFVVEIFRGDRDRAFVAELPVPWLARTLGLAAEEPIFLSLAQGVSGAVAVLAAAVLWNSYRQAPPAQTAGALQ
jgi:phosphatidylglycerol:prolipoprotein diacylglycerol transferase